MRVAAGRGNNGGMEDREIGELERALEQIWEVARGFGLDPFPTRFEIVPASVMYEIGSYALPGPNSRPKTTPRSSATASSSSSTGS